MRARAFLLSLCFVSCHDERAARLLTPGSIALINLEHQIAQHHEDESEALVELLLAKAQFFGDQRALDRAFEVAERAAPTREGLVLRARARAAVHRFEPALSDLGAAEKLGADVSLSVASIELAIGRADRALKTLEAAAIAHPRFEVLTAWASALSALGRFDEADRAFVRAERELESTSPFPFAWVAFARGVMWSERAGDRARGRALYREALSILPEFAAANVHLAEIEAEDGARAEAIARLKSIDDVEAIALLARLTGDRAEIAQAKARYDQLLVKHPLAFADHAAEFELAVGGDADRASMLARQNLANRETERSLALAIRAARRAHQTSSVCALIRRAKSKPRTGVELDGLLEDCQG